jgi:hypothetical protein
MPLIGALFGGRFFGDTSMLPSSRRLERDSGSRSDGDVHANHLLLVLFIPVIGQEERKLDRFSRFPSTDRHVGIQGVTRPFLK